MLEVRRDFLLWLTEVLDGLEGAWNFGDDAALLQVIHALKGTAGSAGFPRLTDAAALLENLIREGRPRDAVAAQYFAVLASCRQLAAAP
jgi:HPt (histidine-containing phosphotransfer) domain-containing protein